MPLDHDFWNDGLYFQSTAPWAIEPNVRAGIHCVLILSRVQEEYQLIAQELARAVGWGFAHYERFSVSIKYISQRIAQLGSESNNKTVEDVEIDHIDQLNLAKTNIPTNGEVDAALEDVVLDDTLDDGEDANKDWMTDNEDGEDSQGDDSRESGDGDVAQAQENKIQADTAINGNEE
ncbi:hypothetical protein PCASD_06083 [Puccinia coronata f. sp. avenae]|uniref:Uncharacterized protein n=1 Tax=Puccinia coronata f. sp. avenae TaxID=200324 RepID=A0A2N5SIS7_9BASI|nr:hypothetical protein PCASD_18236 [Puccinia coronata f. sp. avenae]PLW43066.1 hypothetical protein PCASD_06083 [Puccinia coronata f. sp. avenae]